MNFEGLIPGYYRLRFREYLDRTAPREEQRTARRPLIFADLMVTRDEDSPLQPYAPQGLGEGKRAAMPEFGESEAFEGAEDTIPALEARNTDWEAVSAYKFAIGSAATPPRNRRTEIEEQVRHIKALNQPCPYRNEHGVCSVPYVRCGERHQFATRESQRQQTMPHPCLYLPGNGGDYIVIADNDRRVREFAKNALELFLNVDENRIVAVDSAQKVIEVLNQFKVRNKRVRLLIVDENMPGMSGFDLVNELYSRNHRVDFILMHDPSEAINKPRDYAGDRYVAPRKRVVYKTLLKPIHSDALAEAAMEVVSQSGK